MSVLKRHSQRGDGFDHWVFFNLLKPTLDQNRTPVREACDPTDHPKHTEG